MKAPVKKYSNPNTSLSEDDFARFIEISKRKIPKAAKGYWEMKKKYPNPKFKIS